MPREDFSSELLAGAVDVPCGSETGKIPVDTAGCTSENSSNAHSSPPVKLPTGLSENAGQPFQRGWEREQHRNPLPGIWREHAALGKLFLLHL